MFQSSRKLAADGITVTRVRLWVVRRCVEAEQGAHQAQLPRSHRVEKQTLKASPVLFRELLDSQGDNLLLHDACAKGRTATTTTVRVWVSLAAQSILGRIISCTRAQDPTAQFDVLAPPVLCMRQLNRLEAGNCG